MTNENPTSKAVQYMLEELDRFKRLMTEASKIQDEGERAQAYIDIAVTEFEMLTEQDAITLASLA